jgi:perosamine synthetase
MKKRPVQIPITKPCFDERDRAAVCEPLESGWVVQGPKVKAFELGISAYTGAKHCCATTSCTTALHLALLACGIGRGDEVILPAFTFVATANVAEYIGARPVFVDIDLVTFNIDISKMEQSLGKKTKAVIPVHLFGLPAEMNAVMEIARAHKLRVIEDAACAIGSFHHGRHSGTIGDAGCLSFHPRKSITTGEGGMVLTNDSDIARQVRIMRDHGGEMSDLKRHESGIALLPDYNMLGYNYRMTDIQGALGATQLQKLPMILERKHVLARRYDEALKGLEILRTPAVAKGLIHGYQSYVTLVMPEFSGKLTVARVERYHRMRNKIMAELASRGVATRQGTHAVHALGYYGRKYGIRQWDYPCALAADRLSLALPIYPQMTNTEQNAVIDAVKKAVKQVT